MNQRRQIIAGNWKMYKTLGESCEFIGKLAEKVKECPHSVYLAVPFTALQAASESAKESEIVIGAQNMNDASEGAFTGEVAAFMIKDAGARFVILGHSERRKLYRETNELVNRKVLQAEKNGLEPLVCVGETKEEREAGKTEEVLRQQIEESLSGVKGDFILAYEPVWAIGTGHTATPETAQETHAFCRSVLKELFNKKVSDSTPILYGGSVNPDNAGLLIKQADIDGVLVGGSSLSLEKFGKIVHASTL
ncbi:MAG: triose-phosphate isomerase [Waddliaceae bacterium]